MLRPSIALCCILKNEVKNLPQLLKSVEGCFDAIYLTDTGSTDGSQEWIKQNASIISKCPVYLSHFEWCDDFAKARNFCYSQAKEDFIIWLDLDDCLSDKNAFIRWRDCAMEFADYWLATYNYAYDEKGNPAVSFARERVVRRSINPKWKYAIHEGIQPEKEWNKSYITTWTVNHMRTTEDMAQDRSRNIKIIQKIENKDARLKFYYGKELYENGNPKEALEAFKTAIADDSMEQHDRVLSYQYASYAAQSCADMIKDDFPHEKIKFFKEAMDFCHDGIKLDSNRAEFHVGLGDINLKMGKLLDALPHYASAKFCILPTQNNPYAGPLYYFANNYGEVPSLQISKIYANCGRLDEALKEAKECFELYKNKDAEQIIKQIEELKTISCVECGQDQTDDIVFTCPPNSAYAFDEKLYKEKGMGGSETALIEVATRLKKLTGRKVKVFSDRKDQPEFTGDSGVEWLCNKKIMTYFNKYKPKVHIAWRHNIKLTNAYTYLWCHDLVTRTVEGVKNFDKILCLTEFHKNYVMAMQGVPENMIHVTRNGINPEKFKFEKKPKNPNKLLWMSSPDRGLVEAMFVCDEVKKVYPEIELHIYYGIEKLDMWGMADLRLKLEKMFSEREYVKYHGFTEQTKMYKEVSDGVIWCHPCNFIETFCITAIEMLALGIYPVTRRLGALSNTLAEAEKQGQAVMLNHPCNTKEEIQNYSNEIIKAMKEKKWENVSLDIDSHSWEEVAKEWILEMGLNWQIQ